ncbi:hypothetical protein F4821DRAFT_238691 [Hypoxylon rubiginosum]|uniref:Uncharacterized protein n=1 Tax=Hypoxylon rubiginosum TaxID=110542 RepID=A0ACC0D116_9PEZI|nr:hypothetical protein F4821DRAFT_238691 [Hypoxylon rubiginosum]
MSNDGLKSNRLPSAAITELLKVADWLQSEKAKFQNVDDVNICNNREGLTKATSNLISQFATKVIRASSENRVTAIHFTKSAVVPVEQDWAVYFIPVHIVEGPVMVGDQKLDKGDYCHLEENVEISGDFYAVLLLSRRG